MPTRKQYGTPSAANKAIGGIPIIHYFDFGSKGRGQAVRLLWEDAGIAYEDVRFSFDEWPQYQKEKIFKMNPTGNIPVVELNGQILTQSYPMLRHFARLLGSYDGRNEAERYFADVICDIVIDWRTLFVQAFLSPNQKEDYPKHQSTDRARFLNAIETELSGSSLSRSGPFVIGSEITYSDITLYQICHDESLVQEGRKGLQQYPRIKKLVDAVEARPGIKAFLESDRYLE